MIGRQRPLLSKRKLHHAICKGISAFFEAKACASRLVLRIVLRGIFLTCKRFAWREPQDYAGVTMFENDLANHDDGISAIRLLPTCRPTGEGLYHAALR